MARRHAGARCLPARTRSSPRATSTSRSRGSVREAEDLSDAPPAGGHDRGRPAGGARRRLAARAPTGRRCGPRVPPRVRRRGRRRDRIDPQRGRRDLPDGDRAHHPSSSGPGSSARNRTPTRARAPTPSSPSSGTTGPPNETAVERDTVHLFTGKDLDGSTVGMAGLRALCNGNAYGSRRTSRPT
jgi:hypothetical protein